MQGGNGWARCLYFVGLEWLSLRDLPAVQVIGGGAASGRTHSEAENMQDKISERSLPVGTGNGGQRTNNQVKEKACPQGAILTSLRPINS